jgi:hypothetical protein
MRAHFLALGLTLAGPALADTGISAEIARSGLTATEARLAALPAPTDEDRFALGGVRFLKTVEGALQLRWRSGLTDSLGMLPVLRLPIAENPTPEPAGPGLVADLFRDVAAGMETARLPLDAIADDAAFGVEISLADLWFDVNANSRRDEGEDLLPLLGPMILGWRWADRAPAAPAPVIRFDAADAAWLSAYTHMLGGVANLVLTYDPTEATARVLDARDKMAAFGPVTPDPLTGAEGVGAVDLIAITLDALDSPPDAARAAAARDDFLAMIADNRRFWTLVERETDNDREWLPNDRQTSALGIAVPPGTAKTWQAVLDDAEALLQGKVLAPYWRVSGAGLNVARLFTDPRPVDLAGWIQGAAALPYLEKGRVVSADNWRRFEAMMGGEAMLFTLYLN